MKLLAVLLGKMQRLFHKHYHIQKKRAHHLKSLTYGCFRRVGNQLPTLPHLSRLKTTVSSVSLKVVQPKALALTGANLAIFWIFPSKPAEQNSK